MNGNLKDIADLRKLGNYLRTVREFKGISMKEAAEACGVSCIALQKLETCKYLTGTPKDSTLLAYCNYLSITIELQHRYVLNNGK